MGKPVGSTAHDHMCRCPVCSARYVPFSCPLCERCMFDTHPQVNRCVYGGPFGERGGAGMNFDLGWFQACFYAAGMRRERGAWFRLFGYGLRFKVLPTPRWIELTFSERNGYRRYIRLGRFVIGGLMP